MSDDAFGPYVLGVLIAVAICILELRAAARGTAANATFQVVLGFVLGVVAVIGGVLAITEPAVFNASYGCLGRRTDVWLAAAMRPTPAPCGYRIPASDNWLFYPAAFSAFGAAALGVASAFFNFAGRIKPST